MNMAAEQYNEQQKRIIEALKVSASFDAKTEIARRTAFLRDYLMQCQCRCLVLGISGGVDSTTAALLAQDAVRQARSQGYEAEFIAMRLPYGVQKDEEDAQRALKMIAADVVLTVDIKPASDAMLASVKGAGQTFKNHGQEDFIHGNIKARQRMIAQYAVAGARHGLVIDTEQAAETQVGFITKFGKDTSKNTPQTRLNKRRVRALAKAYGTPDELVYKIPTADLENLAPLHPDEAALCVTYEEIDDFLEGKKVSNAAYETILQRYHATAHKRALPVDPLS